MVTIHTLTLNRFTTNPGDTSPPIVDNNYMQTIGNDIITNVWLNISSFATNELFENRIPSYKKGFSINGAGKSNSSLIGIWEDSTGTLVGGLWADVPYVCPEWRGQHLGREIVIYAFEHGQKDMDELVMFSCEGYHNRISTHRYAVELALERGDYVPPEVLVDYPELTLKIELSKQSLSAA